MAGRMSPLHNATEMTQGVSLAPISANGGTGTTNTINGSTIDLAGRRGVYFILAAGALTGSANYGGYLQTNDLPLDPANGNWTNVNTTTYTNATVAAKTNANAAWEMSYAPVGGLSPVVRAVRTVGENVALTTITHVIY